MENITLNEARAIMEQIGPDGEAVPFSIGFETWNEEKQTGGEFIKIDFAIKAVNLKPNSNRKTFYAGTRNDAATTSSKKQNHHANQTTNLAILAKNELTGKFVHTGRFHKIHYLLITEFNGKEII